MQSRYPFLALLLAVAGGFVVLTTFAFAAGTANWINFGIAVLVTVAGLGTIAARPLARRRYAAGGAVTALIGAWTILVTLGIFSGATQRWLVFASGAAVAAISLAGVASYTRARERRIAQLEGAPIPGASAAVNGQVNLGQQAVAA